MTHDTREVEVFWSDEIWACKNGEQSVAELEKKIHHQLQKAREEERQRCADVFADKVLDLRDESEEPVPREVKLNAVLQALDRPELDQDIDNDCPEHGNSEVAKQLFWKKPLTSHWGCRCKSELNQDKQ